MKQAHPLRARAPGFTLIELLVVVAIIALLISILLPSLSKARESARMVACLSNLKQYAVAQIMYADAWEGYYAPSFTNNDNDKRPLRWHRNRSLRQIMGQEQATTTAEGFLCPSAPQAERDAEHIYHIYGANRVATGIQPPASPLVSIIRSRVVQPTNKVQFIDSTEYWVGDAKANYHVWYDVFGDTSQDPGNNGEQHVSYRHSEGAAGTFFDGHGEYRGKQEWYPSPGAANTQVKRVWYIYQSH